MAIRSFEVCYPRLIAALEWLIANNPLYRGVTIQLPNAAAQQPPADIVAGGDVPALQPAWPLTDAGKLPAADTPGEPEAAEQVELAADAPAQPVDLNQLHGNVMAEDDPAMPMDAMRNLLQGNNGPRRDQQLPYVLQPCDGRPASMYLEQAMEALAFPRHYPNGEFKSSPRAHLCVCMRSYLGS